MKKNIKSRILFHFECHYGIYQTEEILGSSLHSVLDARFGPYQWKIADWLSDRIALVINTDGEIWKVKPL